MTRNMAGTSAFAQNLSRALLLSGLSRAEVAKAVGVSRQSIGFYANGNSEPRYGTLLKLADLFGVTADLLIRESTPEEFYLAYVRAKYLAFVRGKEENDESDG